MAYTEPSADDLRARFAAFADLPDAVIQPALDRAARMVDDSWVNQEDFTEGRLLWAAHELTMEGHGSGLEAEISQAGALGVTSLKSGSLAITRPSGAVSRGDTIYSQRFRQLARLNVGGPRVIRD